MLRDALVAVDTDNEFMSERFSNNTCAAANWIADLFATMNVMYERDLNVTLEEGTTILRTTTDPYSANDTPADGTDLDEFGTYWQTHYGAMSRSFAMLLSGKSSSGNSASGIAWIDAYCQTQSQGGSYSVNQIFTNPQIDVSLSALHRRARARSQLRRVAHALHEHHERQRADRNEYDRPVFQRGELL